MTFLRPTVLWSAGVAVALTLCFSAHCLAIGIDSHNTTLNPDNTIPIADQAPIGMRPADDFAVRVGGRFSAVPIAPNFVITASHWIGVSQWAGWIDRKIYIGRDADFDFKITDFYDYRMDDSWLNGGTNVGPTGPWDLIVLKIEPSSGSDPPSLDQWVNLYDGNEIIGSTLAHGGYGEQQKRLIPDLTLVGSPSAFGSLAWAMDRLQDVGPQSHTLAPGGSTDTIFAQPATNPSDPFYTHYETNLVGNDSGSGWFFQDGWEWKVNGVLSDLEIAGARFSLQSNRDWINDAVTAMGGTMTPAPSAPPTPDKSWSTPTDNDWHSASNWTSSGVPTSSHTVSIANSSTSADVSSAPAVAAQLFVGNAGAAATLNISNDQPLSVSGGIFIGPQTGDTGELIIADNSSVTAENLHVGVYGNGTYLQTGGSVNINSVTYVALKSGSTGSATLQADAQLDSYALVLGHYAGSSGTFDLDSPNAVLNTQATYVGANGDGQFIHNNGTHNTANLSVNADSSYELLDGSLNVTTGADIEGTIDFSNPNSSFSGDGYLRIANNASLILGSGINHLDIAGRLQLDPGSTLQMDIAANNPALFDTISITNSTISNNQFSGNLDLRFLSGFLPDPGDTLDLITYDNRSGDFASISHNGPVGLLVSGSFDDPNNLFSVTFSAWHSGDADLDGDIDNDDLMLIKSNYGLSGASWYDGDFNDNGIVDIHDFIAVKNYFGLTLPPPPGLAFVPEPTGVALMACAGLFAILRRR